MKSIQIVLYIALVILLTACNLPEQNLPAVDETSYQAEATATPYASATSESRVINVDDYGANPYDDQPDSRAIQSALNSLNSGDTLMFSSDVGAEGYQGYLIDQTLFIIWDTSHTDIILTSSDPDSPAELQATEDLLGFVIRLYSRKQWWHSPGLIDNIT